MTIWIKYLLLIFMNVLGCFIQFIFLGENIFNRITKGWRGCRQIVLLGLQPPPDPVLVDSLLKLPYKYPITHQKALPFLLKYFQVCKMMSGSIWLTAYPHHWDLHHPEILGKFEAEFVFKVGLMYRKGIWFPPRVLFEQKRVEIDRAKRDKRNGIIHIENNVWSGFRGFRSLLFHFILPLLTIISLNHYTM